jgi:O-antigen/teichoic acid export membrane protein
VSDLAQDSPEIRRNVAVSSAAQGGARVVHLVLNVATTLIIIRYLSPSSYGGYILVLTSSMLIGLIADFGLTKLATREVSQDLGSEDEILGTVLVARLCLGVLCIGLLQLALIGLGATASLHLAGLVASVMYLGNALMVSAVALYVRIKQQYEAFVQVGMEVFETAVLVVLVVRRASLAMLFVPPTVALALGSLVIVGLVRRRYGVRFRVTLHRLPYLMKEALPIGPALMISVCYLKLDALMLFILRSSREVGLYGSAYQPIEYLFLAAAVVVNVVFPLVTAAYAAGDHDRFAQLYRRGTEMLVAVMVTVPVVLSLIAVPLVERVYGHDYHDAAQPLQLLAVALVLMTVNGWQAFVLLSGGQQRVTLYYNVGALVVAAVGCTVLITAFGMVGAALATLVTAVFVLVCSSVAIRTRLRVHLQLLPIVKILAAAGALWTSLWLIRRAGAPWPVLIPASLVAYPVWLLAFRVVHLSTLRSWRLPDRALESAASGAAEASGEFTVVSPMAEQVVPAYEPDHTREAAS